MIATFVVQLRNEGFFLTFLFYHMFQNADSENPFSILTQDEIVIQNFIFNRTESPVKKNPHILLKCTFKPNKMYYLYEAL